MNKTPSLQRCAGLAHSDTSTLRPHRLLKPVCAVLATGFLLVSCGGEPESNDAPPAVRGLKTIEIRSQEERFTRSYPSVLQPASVTALSFEVAGKLEQLNLDVGQSVKAGDVLATLDPTSLGLQVDAAEAALAQAEAQLRNADADFKRRDTLAKDGIISRAELDQSRASFETAEAQRNQAQKQLESARDNVSKAVITAPFDAIVNSVEVDSFSTVNPGTPIASLYSNSAYEVSFSVSFNVADLMTVGKPVRIIPADIPSLTLEGVVSELGSRANTVASFPVVASLSESDPRLKAGMAVGIEVDFAIPDGGGYTVPLTVLDLSSLPDDPPTRRTETMPGYVFVFDEPTSTVQHREVTLAGVRENDLIISDGLEEGDRVAVAGVSFLKDGQKVKLLPTPGNDSGN